jgi:hypothetical protein
VGQLPFILLKVLFLGSSCFEDMVQNWSHLIHS